MIVSCERCGARYKLDDAKVTERGAKITCPRCRHVFVVYPGGAASQDSSKVVIGSDDGAGAGSEPAPPKKKVSAENLNFRDVGIASWKVRVKIGLIYDFGDIKTLRKYLAEGRVTSDDVISHDGKNWKSIGEIPDLDAYFVEVYEEARRIRDERSKSMFDDEDPTHIVGMGSIGSNLAAQAMRTVSEPAPRAPKGTNSVVGAGASADDLASAMAAALDAEVGGGNGSGGLNNPEVGPQFADPFAAMRSKQAERSKSRRTPSRPATARTATRPTTSATSKASSGGGSSALKNLPLVAAVILLLGGGAWYFSDLFMPAEATSPPEATYQPVRQAPEGKRKGDLRKELEEELKDVEPLPLADEEEDEELDFDKLKPVVPKDVQAAQQGNSPGTFSASGGADMTPNAGSPAANGDLYFSQGNWSAAAGAYAQAGGALSAQQHGNYGIALYNLGRYEEALSELQSGSGSQVLLYMARTLSRLGDPAGAKSYCEQYINATGDQSARAECDSLG